jgi:pre-mRNA cleavage complex 2 protein Pcf11
MFLKLAFILKVLTGVAQPVAFGQGQQFLPVHPQNPGAFIQNPSGMYFCTV